MRCYCRMRTVLSAGLLWFLILKLAFMVLSLELGFLDFDNLPDTNFSCVGKVIGGYYADLETNCQMFHVCTIGQLDEPMDIRFLCLNGTVFDQETRVCERIDEVDCSQSEQFYNLNLELYGNTQASPLEESPETDAPHIIKTTSAPTTTTTERSMLQSTRRPFLTSKGTITTGSSPKVISTHRFPISNSPDIRFNPEEINISLNPGAPPTIQAKPVSFQQQIFSGIGNENNNNKPIITTHTGYGDSENMPQLLRPIAESASISSITQKFKSPLNYALNHERVESAVTPSDINYGFTYQYTNVGNEKYHTEDPNQNGYQQLHSGSADFENIAQRPYRNPFRTRTYKNEQHIKTQRTPYNSHKGVTTFRNPHVASRQHSYQVNTNYDYHVEKPHQVQLALPGLPTLPPLTFSSPAPFTLTQHIDAKRYISEHQSPPRIIISASASISDASGRRLNYSLGTIGVTPLLKMPPKSYDDYKDQDVVLDPFYRDVPKIKANRSKRNTHGVEIPPSTVIKNEQEAVDVLKFLFDWYKEHEKEPIAIPTRPEIITEINDELSVGLEVPLIVDHVTENKTDTTANKDREEKYSYGELFNRTSKFNIIGDILFITNQSPGIRNQDSLPTTPSTVKVDQGSIDYVDDNYEPVLYQDKLTQSQYAGNNISAHIDQVEGSKSYNSGQNSTKQLKKISQENNAPNPTLNLTFPASLINIESYENVESDRSAAVTTNSDEVTVASPETIIDQDYVQIQKDDESTSHIYFSTSTTEIPPLTKSRNRGRGRSRYSYNSLKKENLYDTAVSTTQRNPINDAASHYPDKRFPSLANDAIPTSIVPHLVQNESTDNLEDRYVSENPKKVTMSLRSTLKQESGYINENKEENTSSDKYSDSKSKITSIQSKHKDKRKYGNNAQRKDHDIPGPIIEATDGSSQVGQSNCSKDGSQNSTSQVNFTSLTDCNSADGNTEFNEDIDSIKSSKVETLLDYRTEDHESGPVNENGEDGYSEETVESLTEGGAEISKYKSKKPNKTVHIETGDKDTNKETNSQDYVLEPNTETTTTVTYPFPTDFDTTINTPTSIFVTPSSSTSESGLWDTNENFTLEKHTSTEAIPVEQTPIQKNSQEIPDYSYTQPGNPSEYTADILPLTTELSNLNTQPGNPSEYTADILSLTTELNNPKENDRTYSQNSLESEDKVLSTQKYIGGEKKNKYEITTEDENAEEVISSTHITLLPDENERNLTQPLNVEVKTSTDVINTEYHTDYQTEPTVEKDTIEDETTTTEAGVFVTTDNLFQECCNPFTLKENSQTTISDNVVQNTTANNTSASTYVQEETTILPTTAAPENSTSASTVNPKRNRTAQSRPLVSNEATGRMLGKSGSGFTSRHRNPSRTKSYHGSRRSKDHRFSTRLSLSKPVSRKLYNTVESVTTSNEETAPEVSTAEEKLTVNPASTVKTVKNAENVPSTDAFFYESANPTQAEVIQHDLSTTPLSTLQVPRTQTLTSFIFNCFDKPLNQFYLDPRDCRLFHYCTTGYTKNQLLDMKFVCDLGTYFDHTKLICTKVKPARCV